MNSRYISATHERRHLVAGCWGTVVISCENCGNLTVQFLLFGKLKDYNRGA